MQAICRVTAIFITLVLGRGHAFFWIANHKQSNKIEPLKTKGATTLSITTFSMITLSIVIKMQLSALWHLIMSVFPGNTNLGGRLSTVDLLIKVACF